MPIDQRFNPWNFAAKLALIAFAVLLTVLAYSLRQLLLITFVSVLIAVFWDYLADGILHLLPKRTPRSVGVVLAMLLSAGVFGLFGVFLYDPLNAQMQNFIEQAPEILKNAWARLQPILRNVGVRDFDPTQIDFQAISSRIVESSLTVLGAGVSAVVSLVAIFFLAFFWVIEPDRYRRGAVSLAPHNKRRWLDDVFSEIKSVLRQWMKATALAMATVAVLVTILLWILGVPYALLFGLAAGLFDIIPFLGPSLAFIGPIIIALSISPAAAVSVSAGYLVIQAIEGNLIVPYFLSKEASLPPAMTVFMIFAMGQLFGFLGIILAAPALAILLVLIRAAYHYPEEINVKLTE